MAKAAAATGGKVLRIRKLADKTSGERIVRYDPETGERHLVNPRTGQPEPWPLAGVSVEGDAPTETTASTGWVEKGVGEGWITRENERPVHRPGGTPDSPWAKTHTFLHADALVFHTVDGDVRYTVTHQPDKYHSGPEGTDAVGDPEARVDHFYGLALEG